MVEKLNFGQCYKLGKTIFDSSYQKCLVYYSIYDVNLSKNKTKKSNYKNTLFNFILLYRTLVERIGIEPMTFCLQSRCSPS